MDMKIKIAVLLDGEAREKEVSVDEAIAFLKNQLDAMEELAELIGKMDANILKDLFEKLIPAPIAFKFDAGSSDAGNAPPGDVSISPPWQGTDGIGTMPQITYTNGGGDFECETFESPPKPHNIN